MIAIATLVGLPAESPARKRSGTFVATISKTGLTVEFNYQAANKNTRKGLEHGDA